MDAAARAVDVVNGRDWEALAKLLRDGDPRVRTLALTTLVRHGPRRESGPAWRDAAHDADPRVRLRAAQLAPQLGRAVSCAALLALLDDDDAWVREAAVHALGEHPRCSTRALDALVRTTISDPDPLLREAAVAALGAQGAPKTLDAVLHACDDKPAIRRRAVL
ncbi:MAG TPA: HEAT repeat domain-containing protein, partial [Acidimicrobiia bacterium]|nr:HEAT repeat domain-containing protein [Acidimicrobiia bacterium]